MGKITNAVKNQADIQAKKTPSVSATINEMLDKDGIKKRFDELLGKRSAQFVSSLVSLINGTPQLQKAFFESPQTVIQAGLKAAMYDLPIDTSLGYAYIIPFNNKQSDGSYKMEATFILGYKGMHQLALRTGVYKTINVLEIKEGELLNYNRLSEETEFSFIEDEVAREKAKTIGYAGYYKLINGTEKTIYMTVKQIEMHENMHRKGKYQNKNWKDNFEVMALKTVYRRLIGKWGIMSIDYQSVSDNGAKAIEAINNDLSNDEIIDMTTLGGSDAEESIVKGEEILVNEKVISEDGEIIEQVPLENDLKADEVVNE